MYAARKQKLKQAETRVGGFCWVLASDVKEVRGNGGSSGMECLLPTRVTRIAMRNGSAAKRTGQDCSLRFHLLRETPTYSLPSTKATYVATRPSVKC